MAENIANKGEAEKCRDLAKEFLAAGHFEKALKFLRKSQNLFALPDVPSLIMVAERKQKEAASGEAGQSSSSRQSDVPRASSEPSINSSSPRSHTPEQESGARKIIALSKKCHYQVLGIARSANESEIKKAYRKLALKFHPDKNSAPSAETAFKAISAAMDTLSDAAKREAYDQYGHEASMQTGGGEPQGQPFHGFHGQQVSPEDIFNMFFAQGFNHGGVRFGRRRHQRQPPQYREEAPQEDYQRPNQLINQILQFLPIILLFLMSLSSFSGGSQPIYSLRKENAYRIRRETSARGVVPSIPYFVATNFEQQYPQHSYNFVRVEQAVEADYRDSLSADCAVERHRKQQKILKASWSRRQDEKDEAQAYPTPSCTKYDEIFQSKRKQNTNW